MILKIACCGFSSCVGWRECINAIQIAGYTLRMRKGAPRDDSEGQELGTGGEEMPENWVRSQDARKTQEDGEDAGTAQDLVGGCLAGGALEENGRHQAEN